MMLSITLSGLPEAADSGVTIASLALAAFVRRPEDIRPFVERVGAACS